jgi:hypothetical protein
LDAAGIVSTRLHSIMSGSNQRSSTTVPAITSGFANHEPSDGHGARFSSKLGVVHNGGKAR